MPPGIGYKKRKKKSAAWYHANPNPKSTPKEIVGSHGHKAAGPSILWPALYRHLRAKGKTKAAAAAISNAAWKKKRMGIPTNTPMSARGIAKDEPVRRIGGRKIRKVSGVFQVWVKATPHRRGHWRKLDPRTVDHLHLNPRGRAEKMKKNPKVKAYIEGVAMLRDLADKRDVGKGSPDSSEVHSERPMSYRKKLVKKRARKHKRLKKIMGRDC